MIIDLRSDTVTKPTEDMRKAMYKAEVGDDVYGDDVTVNKLEDMAAEKLGKQSALFVPTGTMGNLIALLTHTTPGHEIILGDQSHIHLFEVSGYSRIAGVGVKLIDDSIGYMNTDKVKESINGDSNIHYRSTDLICIENSHNVSGGIVSSLEYLKKIKAIAKNNNIPVHLDGARIFNAATYLDVDVKEIAKNVDSVMMCLSKGLCAPVGSILAGTKDFINEARLNRKMLGGGMRQSGILAAAGIIALNDMPKILEQDHKNAYKLACGLANIQGIDIDLPNVHTNIIMAGCDDAYKLASDLKDQGILTSPFTKNKLRFTTNHHITSKDIDTVLDKLNKLV